MSDEPQAGAEAPVPPPAGVPPVVAPIEKRYGQYAPPPQYAPPAQYAPPQQYAPPSQYAPPQQYAPPSQYAPPQQYAVPPQYAAPVPPGAGQQWAPPPKPGLVPLRPMGFGTLLGAPFQVLRRNTGPTFGSALIIQFAIYLVTALVVGAAALFAFGRVASATDSDRDQIEAGSIAIILVSAIIPLAVNLVASALLQSILVIEVSREVVGEKRRMGELWRAAGKRLWPLVLWILLEGAAVAVVLAVVVGVIVVLAMLGPVGVVLAIIAGVLALFALIALAVWLGTKLALVPCAIVLERLPVRKAIARSWRLTSRSFWKTFGVIALVSIIVSFAAQVVTYPISFLLGIGSSLLAPNGPTTSGTGSSASEAFGGSDWALTLGTLLILGAVQLVFGAISSVVQAGAISVVYVDLRMRKEGLDLELVRFVEAREAGLTTEADDPFSVPERA